MKKPLLALSITVLALLVTFLAGACASYNIQPIAASALKDWTADKCSLPSGYIIYQPELYFSATITTEPSGKQTVAVSPLYLPNYQKAYRLTTHNFLGKADFSFTLTDGWKLTQIADKSDNTTVANTLASQLKTLLSAAGVDVKGVTEKSKTRTLLYRPAFDEKTGYFTNFVAITAIDDAN